ncbi:GGDEF domain-containing protein [Hoeflea prorocentri]|uniref:diguanylate cyclase n=1 Tax=Hoeflea prorocentri TaxID=1922333 RepID=A0A9X3UFU4_9HYPH|nr:diguanylate cyclase [Hoeflea prorocentri]MCY6379824.1 diguanylate cyclase [Hoeflea prorocentri]MDA5397624.1 diguanylate cyclase [Hoeflea prorocentri]
MRIRQLLMHKGQNEIKLIGPNKSLLEAAHLLQTNNIGALPVVDNEFRLVGIMSERDLVRSMVEFEQAFFEKTVSDVMTSSVVTCRSDDPMDDIYETMIKNGIRHIPVVDDEGLHDILSIRDFEFAHRRLKEQALRDSLTGLHNTANLLNILDGEFNRYRRFQSPLSVASVRLDGFEGINDAEGHAAGDALLKELSKLLVDQTRAYDSVGRTGEDTFAIVFPNTEPKTAIRTCERILQAVRSRGEQAEAPWGNVSIGVAYADQEIRDGMSILRIAANRVQRAADAGGDGIDAPALKGNASETIGSAAHEQRQRTGGSAQH